jgi:hypothetical protein
MAVIMAEGLFHLKRNVCALIHAGSMKLKKSSVALQFRTPFNRFFSFYVTHSFDLQFSYRKKMLRYNDALRKG